MTQVNCTVQGCSYSREGACYAKSIVVGGKGATLTDGTCCGTFLNETAYSNLADHTEYLSACDSVKCTVATCVHHAHATCQLSQIEVSGADEASVYTETDCLNFERA